MASLVLAATIVSPLAAAVSGVAASVETGVGASDGQYTAVSPARLLDTRIGLGAPKVPVGGRSSLVVAVTGRVGVPTSGVAAVAVTVTVVSPSAAGDLTVYTHNVPRPATSNLSFHVGRNVADLVIVKPGADGKVVLYNSSAAGTHLVVDIAGYFRTGAAAQPGGFTAVSPARLLDTRIGLGAPKVPVGGRSPLVAAVTGHAGVPASGVAAVAVTVTVVSPRAAGYLTVYGNNAPRPATSNLSFAAGRNIAGMVIVRPGEDGKVVLYNASTASAHLVVDISGYYRTGAAAQPGGFTAVSAARLLDTRIGLGAPKALAGASSAVPVAVTGRAGVPTSGVAAIAVTVTVVSPGAAGSLTVYGHHVSRPATSNLSFAAGQIIANLVIVTPGADGKIDLYNASTMGTHLVVDIAGYWVAPDHYASSQGGPGRNFYNPSETAVTRANVAGLRPAWNANQIARASFASPVMADGIAYIPGRVPGELSGELLAVDARTGQTLWAASTPGCLPQNGLTIAYGMAFIGCDHSSVGAGATGGVVVAVDLNSRKQVWSRKVSPNQTSELSVADGMVITAGQGDPSSVMGTLGLDAYTGEIRYQIPNPRETWSYAAKNGRLVISGIDGLKVYNDMTGALVWTGVGDYSWGSVSIDAGHILVTGQRQLVGEWSEGGCGKATCAPNWAIDLGYCYLQAGGADGHTVAITAQCNEGVVSPPPNRIVLVNESTGAIAHTIPMPAGQMVSKGAVRSGNLLWVPGGQGGTPYPPGIEAFAADCSANCKPVVDLVGTGFADYPSPSIAVAGGTVLIQTWVSGQVLAYRLN